MWFPFFLLILSLVYLLDIQTILTIVSHSFVFPFAKFSIVWLHIFFNQHRETMTHVQQNGTKLPLLTNLLPMMVSGFGHDDCATED